MLSCVGTSGLSAAAAALELEAGGATCGVVDEALDDLGLDDATEPPLMVTGTLSLSLAVLHTPAPLGLLAIGLPLACVIEPAGPGMSSALLLAFLTFRGADALGTGM